MGKYGIDWLEENKTNGGFLDTQIFDSYYQLDRNNDSIKNPTRYLSAVTIVEIQFDFKTNTYYLVLQLRPFRRATNSTIMISVDSEILNNKIEEKIELPKLVDATVGDVKVVIPTNISISQINYGVDIKFKDSYKEEFTIYGQNNRNDVYLRGFEVIANEELANKYKDLIVSEVVFDKDNILIEYGFTDYSYGGEWKRIDGIIPYKNEEGVWTSDVVANPEKYLESHLDWYYSDERMVDYIETHKLLPQWKIDAIRAANYEDIFSLEYRLKSAIKFIPLVLVIIIFLVILIKKIKKNKIRK